MIKCPFCQFNNEDGALFCEQCKSDLASVAPDTHPEPVPVAAILEESVQAIPVEPIPVATATPIEPIPVATATPIEPIPVAPIEPIPVAQAEHAVPVADIVEAPAIPVAAPVEQAPLPIPVPAMAPPPVEPIPVPAAAAPPTTPAPAPTPAAPAPAAPAAAAPAAAAPGKFAEGTQPRLVVIRGQKIGAEFPIYPDLNFIGRADEKPVDIDLEDQEPPDRIWCSRQHALITLEDGTLTIEDLNSANGTYVNRARVYPGQKRPITINDVIQIGNVQMKVKV